MLLCFAFAFLKFAPAQSSISRLSNSQQTNSPTANEIERASYVINLDLDFDNRRYAGTERVRWTNNGDSPTSTLYFHLYANMRPSKDALTNVTQIDDVEQNFEADEPRIEILAARAVESNQALSFILDEGATLLRVPLHASVAARASVTIEIDFRGSVPEIDAEETGLLAHVVQQVDSVLRDVREVRRARELQFYARGVMLLGAFYPILAVRDGDDWRRDKAILSVGRVLHTEVADYDVRVTSDRDLKIFTSGAETKSTLVVTSIDDKSNAATIDNNSRAPRLMRRFKSRNLREFALLAGHTLNVKEASAAGVTVRSIYLPEHEATARRALVTATEAVKIFTRNFGALPLGPQINIAEAPLVAGRGSAKFAGLGIVASAFYVDFDSPVVRNLPELVREQRQSVEDSLEWTIAQAVAREWWGASVGSDAEREPVLDESLANMSALIYYRARYGDERATAAMEDQLRGVYVVYRTFGGEDTQANRAASDYRNSFQFSAIVAGKGALMLESLRRVIGDAHFFRALADYYKTNQNELADIDDLRDSFIATAPIETAINRRFIKQHFNRWLDERRGDTDIAPPNPQLASALGLNTLNTSPPDERAAGSNRNRFSRLGIFFWKQMTRIR